MGGCLSQSSIRKANELERFRPEQTNFVEYFFSEQASFHNDLLFEVPKESMGNLLHINIGSLTFKSSPTVLGKGTGLLISSNLVLTSAHNLCNHSNKQKYFDFKFYPGQEGPLMKYYQAESCFYCPNFERSPKPINDYALIKLKEKVKRDEFIPLNGNVQNLKQNINTAKLAILGYPASKYKQLSLTQDDSLGTSQWGLVREGRMKEIDEKQEAIFHQISTESGQSGAPILLIEDKAITVVGIHKGAKYHNGVLDSNSGRLITSKFIQVLFQQADRMGAEPFKVHQYPKEAITKKIQELLNTENQQQLQEVLAESPKNQLVQSTYNKQNEPPSRKSIEYVKKKGVETLLNSELVKAEGIEFIIYSLDLPRTLQLLFRASEHQFKTKQFHKYCDNIPHTFTLYRTQFGKTIAGYTPLVWESPQRGNFVGDPSGKSFLLSITKGCILQLIHPQPSTIGITNHQLFIVLPPLRQFHNFYPRSSRKNDYRQQKRCNCLPFRFRPMLCQRHLHYKQMPLKQYRLLLPHELQLPSKVQK